MKSTGGRGHVPLGSSRDPIAPQLDDLGVDSVAIQLAVLVATRAEHVRIKQTSIQLLVDCDDVHFDDPEDVAVKLRLSTKQDAGLFVHDKPVEIGTGAKHVECRMEAASFNLPEFGSDQVRRPRQKCELLGDVELQVAKVPRGVDQNLSRPDAVGVGRSAFICFEPHY